MDPKLEAMLRGARESLAEGVDNATVEAWLRENGWERSLADLANRVERDQQKATTAGARKASREAPGALPAIARIPLAFMRGITGGFLPEMIGTSASSFGYDPDALSQDIRGQLDRARFEHPVEAGVSEMAGAMSTLPVTGVGGASARGLPTLARVVGTGLAEGAVAGAGYAEPGERLAGAARGAALGTAAGAVPAGAYGLWRTLRTPETVAFTKAARAAPSVNERLRALARERSAWAASEAGYGGLPDVTVTGAPAFFAQPRVRQLVAQAEELQKIGRFPQPTPQGVYTFKTLQATKERLDRAVNSAYGNRLGDLGQELGSVRDDLVALLDQAVPGYSEVNAAYRALKDRERALASGFVTSGGTLDKEARKLLGEAPERLSLDPREAAPKLSQYADESVGEFRHGLAAGARGRLPEHQLREGAVQAVVGSLSPLNWWQTFGRGTMRALGSRPTAIERAQTLYSRLPRGAAPKLSQSRVTQSYVPAGLGFLLGSHDYAQPETEETP